jgi:HSP20 family protein
MQRVTYEVMLDRVRELYQAVTGSPLPASIPTRSDVAEESQVVQRFAELEAAVRIVPTLVREVSTFGFSPSVNLVDHDGELVVELAAPGVQRDDVGVTLQGETLIVYGVKREPVQGRRLLAEVPRGPFRRVVPLPEPVSKEPKLEVEDGVIRVSLRKRSTGASAGVAQA